jgi:hypothetical protein
VLGSTENAPYDKFNSTQLDFILTIASTIQLDQVILQQTFLQVTIELQMLHDVLSSNALICPLLMWLTT